MKVLLDADALIALSKSDDSNHLKAVSLSAKIENLSIYLSPFTIGECVNFFSYKVSQEAAKQFLQKMRALNLTELPLEVFVQREADQIFYAQNKKGTSWFDCFNVASIRFYSLDLIFSFDRFYSRMGIKRVE